jgi:hypothetical protein
MREIASCRIEGYASTAFISRLDPSAAPQDTRTGIRRCVSVGRSAGRAVHFYRLTALPPYRLPLTKLEPLPGAWATRLLPLHRPRIAGQEPGRPQLSAMLSVGLDQRSRDGQP